MTKPLTPKQRVLKRYPGAVCLCAGGKLWEIYCDGVTLSAWCASARAAWAAAARKIREGK